MAETYSYCEGEDRIDISISDSIGVTTYNNQYEQNDSLITETYKKMTLTASPTPAEDLSIYISYEAGRVWNDFYNEPDEWFTSSQIVNFPAGQSSVEVDILITQSFCYGYTAPEDYGY